MDVLQPLIDARLNARTVEMFAASFVKTPFARAMLDRGQPVKFFIPVQHVDGVDFSGVDVTLTAVRRESLVKVADRGRGAERGNGYSSNPAGPLQPGDYGVHSHPSTTALLKTGPASA